MTLLYLKRLRKAREIFHVFNYNIPKKHGMETMDLGISQKNKGGINVDTKATRTISQTSQFEKMSSWERIFHMFFDTNGVFSTQRDIAKAVNQYWASKNKVSNMTQSTVSKEIGGTITYHNTTYCIVKRPQLDKKGQPIGVCYQMISKRQEDVAWEDSKSRLLDEDLLVSDKICKVSNYMYVFQLKSEEVKKEKRKPTANSSEEDKVHNDKAELARKTALAMQKKAKKVEGYFRAMIPDRVLFDVACVKKNVFVILNNTYKTNDGKKDTEIKKYAEKLKAFFEE